METKNPNEVRVWTRYQLRKQGAGFDFNDRKKIMEDVVMPVFAVKAVNKPIDDVLAFNERKRKRNLEDNELEEAGTRPLPGSTYFVEDVEKTAKYQEYENDRKQKNIKAKVQKQIDAKELVTNVFAEMLKVKSETGTDEPTLAEMKTTCKDNGYPAKEWQILNKTAIIEYLKSKQL